MTWLLYVGSNILLAMSLALLAWLTQRVLQRPGLARLLWILVLVKLLTPPILGGLPTLQPGPVSCWFGVCSCGPHSESLIASLLPQTLFAVWACGVMVAGLTSWSNWRRLQQLLCRAEAAPSEWQSSALQLSRQLGLKTPPDILTVPGRLPPMVLAGRGRARLILPSEFIGDVPREQREVLLLHELTHLKRGDHWIRFFETSVAIVYWWLPMVGWIRRQLRICEELSCDQRVLDEMPAARREYARLLLDIIDFTAPIPTSVVSQATLMSAADELKLRLKSILTLSRPTPASRIISVMVIGVALLVIPCQLNFAQGMMASAPAPFTEPPPEPNLWADMSLEASVWRMPPETSPTNTVDIQSYCCSFSPDSK